MSPPEVPFETVQKWQEIVNIVAEIMHGWPDIRHDLCAR